MPVTTRNDPYPGFNFLIEIDGTVRGAFSEVSGLEVEARRHRVPHGQRGHHRPEAPRGSRSTPTSR